MPANIKIVKFGTPKKNNRPKPPKIWIYNAELHQKQCRHYRKQEQSDLGLYCLLRSIFRNTVDAQCLITQVSQGNGFQRI